MKLSKADTKAHKAAMALVAESATRRLTVDEREQVLETFHEGATNMNGAVGAFFTPSGLARDFAIEVPEGARILDLCAGIGALSYWSDREARSIVCVERNAEYVAVGRAVMPDATWVCASVFDLDAYRHLGPFDVVISNPPFGRIPATDYDGPYTGGEFEYRVMEIASRLAPYGVFILPQMSAPFRYSERQGYREEEGEKARRFREQTGIVMRPNCGIDTAVYLREWKGVSPMCEIVLCQFGEQDPTDLPDYARPPVVDAPPVVATEPEPAPVLPTKPVEPLMVGATQLGLFAGRSA